MPLLRAFIDDDNLWLQGWEYVEPCLNSPTGADFVLIDTVWVT